MFVLKLWLVSFCSTVLVEDEILPLIIASTVPCAFRKQYGYGTYSESSVVDGSAYPDPYQTFHFDAEQDSDPDLTPILLLFTEAPVYIVLSLSSIS
jgi:hypothetical protein